MTDQYAVIGNPIAHSLSPVIHARFAQDTGEALEYHKILAEPDDFTQVCSEFFNLKGKGMNVTVPFKQAALDLSNRLSPRAQAAGAVNTLIKHANGQIEGDNTDGAGLVRDLVRNHGLALSQMRILILGAGGAVRGVIAPLLEQRPQSLTIANRTVEKASQLAQRFAEFGPVSGIGLNQTSEHAPYDLIINATSAGLSKENPELPAGLFADDACAYDMLYAPHVTPFLHWASEQGVKRCHDGFGMLVEQAAESFYLWRGTRPETQYVIREFRP